MQAGLDSCLQYLLSRELVFLGPPKVRSSCLSGAGGMGCTCSKTASQPGYNFTLLEHRQSRRRNVFQRLDQGEKLSAVLQQLHAQRMKAQTSQDVASSSPSSGSGASKQSAAPLDQHNSGSPSGAVCDLEMPRFTPDQLEGLEEGLDLTRWLFCTTCAASIPETWQRELCGVSLQLKTKLRDPHFVAKRCDLDSSGDLDIHELKQATRAFGVELPRGLMQELMAGEGCISKGRFAEIVAKPPPEAEKIVPTIPHSLRGMALGQLQHLENLFITSGWLPAQCNAFNIKHAAAISQKNKFHQAANLYAMDSYVVTPMTKPGSCSARDEDATCSVPPADHETSFSELVNPHGLVVHCFVSHYWGHLFSQTITALRRWAEMNFQQMGTQCPKFAVFWICLFALNQHAVADEVGTSPMQGPFNAALAQAKAGAVMVLDEEINPFNRLWCLFEISRLKDLKQPFELICDMGSLSKPESLSAGQADPAAVESMLQATCEALWEVSAANAQASVNVDMLCIWEEIADPGQREVLKRCRPKLLRVGMKEKSPWKAATRYRFTEFDQHIQSLLSTALLQFYLDQNHYNAAARCCEHGACFNAEQFAEINAKVVEDERTIWLNRCLTCNSQDHRLGTVQLLLQSGAEATNEAFLAAACGGHVAVAKVLLDHDADMAAADNTGKTVLMHAAFGGHEALAKELLDHGADVAAAANTGHTALMLAAVNGHEALAKVLLDHGADVAAADNNGATALMLAARSGHEALAKVLLDHGADVAAADNDGTTALMLAASRGHQAVVKVLLDHGADVADVYPGWNTESALMFGSDLGAEVVVKMLEDFD